jgi:hypothetical protein
MTAIAGFRCVDGSIVIAADTEETYGEDKAYSHKLFPIERPTCRLCVAGAGLGYLVDYANEQFVSAIDDDEIQDVEQFRDRIADILEHAYQDGGKFTRFPVERLIDSRVDLVVGVQFFDKNEKIWTLPALFECRSNMVTRILKNKQCCVVAAGEVLKQTAIQLSGLGLDSGLAEWACLYLVHEAKRRFGGVGGKTHLFTMRRDGTFSYDRGRLWNEREAILENLNRAIQPLILSLSPSLAKDDTRRLIRGSMNWFISAKRHIDKVDKNVGKAKHEFLQVPNKDLEKFMKQLRATTRSVSRKSAQEQ